MLNQQSPKLQKRLERYLGLRPRSVKEVREFLSLRVKLEIEEVDLIINELIDLGILNDTAFANWWISGRLQFKAYGSRKISMELMQKGINREIIENELKNFKLEDNYQDNMMEKALSLAERYIQRHNTESKSKLRAKLSQYLLARGFEYDIIDTVWQKIN